MTTEQAVGMWDVYSRGVHSELNLMANGAYSHLLWGGIQGHWGHWSVENAAEGDVLHLQLQGAQPANAPGVQWPESENWKIQGTLEDMFLMTQDSMLIRRGAGVQVSAPILGMGGPPMFPMGPPPMYPMGPPPMYPMGPPPMYPTAPPMFGGVGMPLGFPDPGPAPNAAGGMPQVAAPMQMAPMQVGPPPVPTPMLPLPNYSAINAQWKQLHDQQLVSFKQQNDRTRQATQQGVQQFLDYIRS